MNDNPFNDYNNYEPYKSERPETPPPVKKDQTLKIIAIVAIAIMCLALVVNVIVLSSLQDKISKEFSAEMSSKINQEYKDAINDVLKDQDIVDDIVDQATESASGELNKSVTEIIGERAFNSAAVINSTDNSSFESAGSGFLFSNEVVIAGKKTRLVATNAHVVLYEKKTSSGGFPFGSVSYSYAVAPTITTKFANDDKTYKMQVLACGSYKSDNITTEYNSQTDIAILMFVGEYPSTTTHKALDLSTEMSVGEDIAIIGNPAGIGQSSISGGVLSSLPMKVTSWDDTAYFVMTDAAVNPGNSGGPMLNRKCQLVGIIESKIVDDTIEGMGFALTTSTFISFIEWAEKNNSTGTIIDIPYTLAS